MKTDKVMYALRLAHDPREWAFFEELRIGGGFGKDSEQRFDAWAINYRPSKQNKTVCYELKVSKSDFLNEIRKPRKRRAGLRLSNEFYFVTPKGLVKIEEVPPECGLIEVGEGDTLHTKIKAPFRNTIPPTFNFMSSVCRRFDADRLREFQYYLDVNHRINEEGAACMQALAEHIQRWRNFNQGNKEVPDKIADALEALREDVKDILLQNKRIK